MGGGPRVAGAVDGGPVGHLQHVGHVAGGGDVEQRQPHPGVLVDVEHARHQHAGVHRRRLARLEDDLEVGVPGLQPAQGPHQEVHVVVGLGDPVPAAAVQPLHLRQPVAEAGLEGLQHAREDPRTLLAEGVEVQAVHPLGQGLPQHRAGGAQARAGGAGVVERDLDLAVLRVAAQAHLDLPAAGAHRGQVALELGARVEHQVVGVAQGLGQVLGRKGRRVGVHLPAELLAREAGLVGAARAAAVQVRTQHVEGGPEGEALEREQHLAAGLGAHPREDAPVALEEPAVHHEAGARDPPPVEVGDGRLGGHGRSVSSRGRRVPAARPRKPQTGSGPSGAVSTQGRPHLPISCMNGSGSNCSTFHTPGLRQRPSTSSFAPSIAGTPVV